MVEMWAPVALAWLCLLARVSRTGGAVPTLPLLLGQGVSLTQRLFDDPGVFRLDGEQTLVVHPLVGHHRLVLDDHPTLALDGFLVVDGVPHRPDESLAAGEAAFAAGSPVGIDVLEEATDVAPRGPLAGRGGLAHQDDGEVEVMRVGFHREVGGAADDVAEGDERLQQQGHGIGLGEGLDQLDDGTGRPVDSGLGERCRPAWLGRGGEVLLPSPLVVFLRARVSGPHAPIGQRWLLWLEHETGLVPFRGRIGLGRGVRRERGLLSFSGLGVFSCAGLAVTL
jgi:hypothetical protein